MFLIPYFILHKIVCETSTKEDIDQKTDLLATGKNIFHTVEKYIPGDLLR